jgi:A/G-specific adenine glycosylase
MAVLRDAPGPVTQPDLDAVWDVAAQRERALAGLLVDGLVVSSDDGRYRLPT